MTCDNSLKTMLLGDSSEQAVRSSCVLFWLRIKRTGCRQRCYSWLVCVRSPPLRQTHLLSHTNVP